MKKLQVGVIGLGYWGPNYVRNFHNHPKSQVTWACDLSDTFLQKIQHQYPLVKLTKNFQDLLDDESLDLIAIATPPKSHFKIGSLALKAGKHIILAKPLTTNFSDAQNLFILAKKKKLLLQSDLTYLYSEPLRIIKQEIDKNKLGKPVFFDSIRANAGPIRDDANVIWDLAPHDLAILDYLFGLLPTSVLATGSKHYSKSTTEEIAHIVLTYPDNFTADIHLSWLSPVKMRSIIISGTKEMIHFDDAHPDEKVRIYDSQIIDVHEKNSARKLYYKNGNILISKLDNKEALYTEIDQIINYILNNSINYQNAELSLRVIKILELCDRSLSENKHILLK